MMTTHNEDIRRRARTQNEAQRRCDAWQQHEKMIYDDVARQLAATCNNTVMKKRDVN